MGKYYKENKSKSLLDKLTVKDITYSIFVYESVHDVWKEETIKEVQTCDTKEKKQKAFQHVAVNKYHHVKKGTQMVLYQDGWTSAGQVYFGQICNEISDIMTNCKLWSTLKMHRYVLDEDNAADNDDDSDTPWTRRMKMKAVLYLYLVKSMTIPVILMMRATTNRMMMKMSRDDRSDKECSQFEVIMMFS